MTNASTRRWRLHPLCDGVRVWALPAVLMAKSALRERNRVAQSNARQRRWSLRELISCLATTWP